MFRYVCPLVVCVFAFGLGALAYGQEAQVQGQVLDPSGAGITKALVRVVEQQTGAERKTQTNDNGQYTVPGLTPGSYKIFVEAPGFSTAMSDRVTLNSGQSAVMNFTLKVGATSADIVVTAEKKEEKLQDVPLSITALSAETLTQENHASLTEFFTSIPGLNVTKGLYSSSTITLRGLNSGGGFPTVSVLIDGIPLESGFWVPDVDPGDLSRIEVLRGPQGTLYGANSMGGLINYITKEPEFDKAFSSLSAGVNGVDGGDVGYNLRASTNMPINEHMGLRASGFFRRDPGYIANPVYNKKNVNFSETGDFNLSFLWRPSEALSVKLSGSYQSVLPNAPNETLTPPTGQLFTQTYLPGVRGFQRELQAYSATIKGKFAGMELTSLTAYSINDAIGTLDWTNTFGAAAQAEFGVGGVRHENHTVLRRVTQELRLTGALGSRLTWLVGGFYSHQRFANDQHTKAVNPVTGVAVGDYGQWRFPAYAESRAGFVNVDYKFSEQLDLQLGGRWTEEIDHQYEGVQLGFGGPPSLSPPTTTDDKKPTYSIAPRFHIAPDTMVYARVASGFRQGVSNAGDVSLFPQAHIPLQSKPDETVNYEVGLKGDFLDRRLTVDTSVYYIDWKDIQVNVNVPSTVFGSAFGYSTNGGAAKSEGAEFSAEFHPARGWEVQGWLAYDDAVLTKPFPPGSDLVANVGDRLPEGAEWSGNLSGEREFDLGNNRLLTTGAKTSYMGKRFGNFVSAGDRMIWPAFTRWDLFARLRMDPWSVDAYVNNLSNARGLVGQNVFIPGSVVVIQPRTIGVNVTRDF